MCVLMLLFVFISVFYLFACMLACFSCSFFSTAAVGSCIINKKGQTRQQTCHDMPV